MSWTDNEMDKLFQKEAGKQSFEYKDAYWKEMEAMLPAAKGGDFYWFLTSGIFVALLFVTPFLGVLNESRKAEVLAMEAESSEVNTTINNESLEKQSSNMIAENKVITAINNEVEKEYLADNTVLNQPRKDEVQRSNVTPVKSNSIRVYKKNTSDSSTPIILADSHAGLNASDRKTNHNIVDSKHIELSNQVTKESTFTSAIDKKEELEQIDVESLNTRDVSLLDQNAPLELQNITYDLSLPWSSSFYLEGNAGLSQSLITPSENNSYSFGAGLGTQFRKGRIVFTTGVNVIWSHYKDLLLTRQAKIYGFGSEVVQSHINFSELYTLEANLNVGYSFGRHNLNIGVRPSYVVGSKVKVTQSAELEDGNRTYYGFMDGINRWGVKPSFGYGFDLTNKLTVGVNLSTQILSSVNEEFINGVNKKFPIDGQIYLRKTLRLRK